MAVHQKRGSSGAKAIVSNSSLAFVTLAKQNYGLSLISMPKLDVDPRRDDDASPMSSYRCMLRPT